MIHPPGHHEQRKEEHLAAAVMEAFDRHADRWFRLSEPTFELLPSLHQVSESGRHCRDALQRLDPGEGMDECLDDAQIEGHLSELGYLAELDNGEGCQLDQDLTVDQQGCDDDR